LSQICIKRFENSLITSIALSKIHKEGVPFRIIISSINPLYSLAGFLQDIISENILPAKSRIKNSFEFHNKLTGIDKTIDKTIDRDGFIRCYFSVH